MYKMQQIFQNEFKPVSHSGHSLPEGYTVEKKVFRKEYSNYNNPKITSVLSCLYQNGTSSTSLTSVSPKLIQISSFIKNKVSAGYFDLTAVYGPSDILTLPPYRCTPRSILKNKVPVTQSKCVKTLGLEPTSLGRAFPWFWTSPQKVNFFYV